MEGLLWLTSLQVLNIHRCHLTGRAVSQIKQGHWQHLPKLHLANNDLSGDVVRAVKGVLRLTALIEINLLIV
jgi:hypothetical protein